MHDTERQQQQQTCHLIRSDKHNAIYYSAKQQQLEYVSMQMWKSWHQKKKVYK